MEILWLLIAYAGGLVAKLGRLPPLVGFLAAGFALNFAGVTSDEPLEALSGLGITLMLFTIGLKLNVSDLARREVWGGTIGHMIPFVVGATGLLLGVGALGVGLGPEVTPLTAGLFAFALSFSSTVCIIKILEDSGELATRHGKLSMGVLVVQDLVAVVFLVVATGQTPNAGVIAFPLLYFARPLLARLLRLAGHGELVPLTGFVFALGAYELFEWAGVKGDLGALVAGMLLSSEPKSSELARALLSFKDLFLVGFFLSIGLTALPDASMVVASIALCALLPVKLALFFAVFSRLRLRLRASYLGSLALSNYSEFGLIVAMFAVDAGWLSENALVVLAMAVALSFVLTSVIYRSAHQGYARVRDRLRRFESPHRLPEDVIERPSRAEILVVGTGRVGRGAFTALHELVGDRVWGMDADRELVRRQQAAGLHVFAGDGESADLWEGIDVLSIKLVLLAVPAVDDCRNISEQLRLAGYPGEIAAIARYEDDREALLASGIDHIFNFFAEAGAGFAEDSLRLVEPPIERPPAD